MRALALAALLVLPLPLAAQHEGHGAPAPAKNAKPAKVASAAGARVLEVTARDFAFDLKDTVAAGLTTIRLTNQGPEMHHVVLLKLEGGKTMSDLFAVMAKHDGPLPEWVTEVGGPNAPVPGGVSEVTLDLPAGRYAMVCVIPSADGKPHVMKGMAKELFVVAAKGRAVAAKPKVDVTMTLDDYSFELSKPLVAGKQVIRVVNAAKQAHEVFIAQLAPGKTPADLLAWIEKQDGPPPAKPMGGTTGMMQHGWNDVHIELEAGNYALICFYPDAKDGKPHFVHGMIRQITVAPSARTAAR